MYKRQLISRGVVTGADVTEQMGALFPARREVIDIPPTATSEIDDKVLGQVIQTFSRGLAPGPSGLRADHILQIANHKYGKLKNELVALLCSFTQVAISGKIPPSLAPWLCGGRAIPLRKKDGSIRPLVVGEVLRASVSRYVLTKVEGAAAEALSAIQLGYSPGRSSKKVGPRASQ